MSSNVMDLNRAVGVILTRLIRESPMSQAEVARRAGITPSSLTRKLFDKSPFKIPEVLAIIEILDRTPASIFTEVGALISGTSSSDDDVNQSVVEWSAKIIQTLFRRYDITDKAQAKRLVRERFTEGDYRIYVGALKNLDDNGRLG